MHRRSILVGPLVAIISSRITRAAEIGPGRIAAGRMVFEWTHSAARIHGRLSAPAPGWLAVGFNDKAALADTRFVIASVFGDRVRAEEHIALVPHHVEVSTLGGIPALSDLSGEIVGRETHLAFSLPHNSGGLYARQLEPGTQTHLMLAWSHDPDFTHHSAWRRHYDITL